MKFALITEGVSEHRIIKHIISKYFKDRDPEINQIQPKLVHEKQNDTGGWDEVLKYCQRPELSDIFVENDYLVIQIDTDQSQNNPFNVLHTKIDLQSGNNVNKSTEELYIDIKNKLESLISEEILAKYRNRIFYAICSHTIECWLLPIYFTNNHKSDTNTCIGTLNRQLNRNNIPSLPTLSKSKNSPQAIKTYNSILSNWKKRHEIENAAQHQFGFLKFIESLNTIQ